MIRFRELPAAWVAAAAGLYVFFFVASAPATLLSSSLARVSGGKAVLSACEGTLWEGAGLLTLVAPDNTGVALRTQWELRPLAFLAGRLGFNVASAGTAAFIRGGLEVGPRSLALRGLSASLPAAWASLANIPLPLTHLDGNLRIDAPALMLARSAVNGRAVVTWRNASSDQTGALGSYRATITGDGRQADIALATEAEEGLAAEGHGTWDVATGATKFDGTLKSTTSAGAVEPLLAMVGPEQGGAHPFTFTGKFLVGQ